MFVYLVINPQDILTPPTFDTPGTKRAEIASNETSDTRNCDRQCRDDFGIYMKPNTNEEEAGRTQFRLIETRENYHGHRHVVRVRLVQLQELDSANSMSNKLETKQSPQVVETK